MSRPKGSLNKKTRAALHAAVRGEIWEGTKPLDFLNKIMLDTEQPMPLRVECAKAAAQYVHPKLSNIELTNKGETWTDMLRGLPSQKDTQPDSAPVEPEGRVLQ